MREETQCWYLQPNQSSPPVCCLVHPVPKDIPNHANNPFRNSQQIQIPLISTRALPAASEEHAYIATSTVHFSHDQLLDGDHAH